MVENYLLAQFNKSNNNVLKEVPGSRSRCSVQYGSYAVQKGNTKLVSDLSKFICSVQKNGQLAKIYQRRGHAVAADAGLQVRAVTGVAGGSAAGHPRLARTSSLPPG